MCQNEGHNRSSRLCPQYHSEEAVRAREEKAKQLEEQKRQAEEQKQQEEEQARKRNEEIINLRRELDAQRSIHTIMRFLSPPLPLSLSLPS